MKRARTLAEAELQATLNPMTNVQAPGRDPGPDGIGWPEITFVAGFLMVTAGLALFWPPLAFVFAGFGLAVAGWKVS
jgi:hypothetical protein